jgi:uncharacterized protein
MGRRILCGLGEIGGLRIAALVLAAALGTTIALADAPKAVQAGGSKKSDGVVKVKLKAEPEKPGADGQQVVTLSLEIDKGWHIYANPVGNNDLTGSQTVVKVGGQKPPVLKVAYPEGKLVKDKVVGDYRTYEDKVAITATVQRTAGDKGPLEVSVSFQACDASKCLPPATVKLTVP